MTTYLVPISPRLTLASQRPNQYKQYTNYHHHTHTVLCLFWEQAPLACENFATLCANGSDGKPAPVGQSGKPLTYRQSSVHRVVPGFVVQGGDFVFVRKG